MALDMAFAQLLASIVASAIGFALAKSGKALWRPILGFVLGWIVGWIAGFALGVAFFKGDSVGVQMRAMGTTFWMALIFSGVGVFLGRKRLKAGRASAGVVGGITSRVVVASNVTRSENISQKSFAAAPGSASIPPREEHHRQPILNHLSPVTPMQTTTISTAPEAFSFDEDAVYEVVANEMDSGKMDKGLWTRLYAEHDGDEKKTKIAYIKQRAEKLMAGERSRQIEIEAENVREATRQAESARREKVLKERRTVKRVVINADKFESFGDLVSHAERKGFSTAKYWLGLTYMTGYVVGQDLQEARLWLENAANEAHEQAQHLVALLDSNHWVLDSDVLGEALRRSVKDADFFGVQAIASRFPDSINQGDSNGYTAMHISANGSSEQILKFLIANGGDVQRKNLYGKSPYDISNDLMKGAFTA